MKRRQVGAGPLALGAARHRTPWRPFQPARTAFIALTCSVAAIAAMGMARAAPANEVYCRASGANASRIATLRDAGRSSDQAVAAVATELGQYDTEALRSAAALLFGRFRLMSPENAAFEFYLDCLDDDVGMPAPAGEPQPAVPHGR